MFRPAFVFICLWFCAVVGGRAQDLRSLTLAEFESELASLDQPTLINFWATWCKPCVAELPYFAELAGQEEVADWRFIFVSFDFNEAQVQTFLEDRPLPGEVWYLTDSHRDPDWIERLESQWSGAIPATLILSGQERAFHEGGLKPEALSALVAPFLGK